MSYIKHLLSSSSSLKNKEVLTNHGGGKIERSGSRFWKTLCKCLLSPLNMALVYVFPYIWVIFLSLSHTNSMSHSYSFDSFEESLWLYHIMFGFTRRVNATKSLVMPCNVQGKFHFKPTICSIIKFHPHVSPYSFNPPYYITLCVYFMSMMGDTSWPSFDESVPVDFNTLSRN
jgi:hypothetical protein